MKPNGKAPHPPPAIIQPAVARRVQLSTPAGRERCEACGTLFDPRREGEPGGSRPWDPVPLCSRCAAPRHCEAA